MTLTAEYLRERLHYDPETGVFTWRPKDGSGEDDDRWNTRYAGAIAGSLDEPEGYIRIKIDGRFYKAHILAWLHQTGRWPRERVDHKNRKRADNRWLNLRDATHAENARNASLRKDSTGGRKGVTWLKARSRWAAVIRVGGRQRCLGLFRDKEAAAAAYLVAAERHFGAFATDGV